MKKILLCFLLSLIISFIHPLSSFPQGQERIIITTYYPSPSGIYNQIVAKTMGVGDHDPDGPAGPLTADGFITPDDAPDPTVPANDGIIWARQLTMVNVRSNAIRANYVGIMLGGNAPLPPPSPPPQLHIDDGNVDVGIKMTNDAVTQDGFDIFLAQNGVTANIWNEENGPMRFGTNNLNRMRITNTGNVGIDTNTPQNRLDVEGAMVVGAGYSGTETAPAGTDLLVEGSVGIGTTTPKNKLDVEGRMVIGAGYSGTGGIAAPANGLLVEGNTAIGATNPLGNKLYVFGNQRITGTLTVNGNLTIPTNTLTVSNLAVDNNDFGDFAVAIANNLTVSGSIFGSDVAEDIECPDCETSDVVIRDNEHNQSLKRSYKSYDWTVAGIISETPTLYMGKKESNTAKPLALVGQVRCKVTSEGGPIKRGDLLVTSSKSGFAMRGDIDKIKPGMIIAKALEPLDEGDGKIMVLITGN